MTISTLSLRISFTRQCCASPGIRRCWHQWQRTRVPVVKWFTLLSRANLRHWRTPWYCHRVEWYHSMGSPCMVNIKKKVVKMELSIICLFIAATPFCYLYDDPCLMYYTFRAFYLRHWFRLHTVSSHDQGIVALCLLFERLLQSHDSQLWAHFRSLHIQP